MSKVLSAAGALLLAGIGVWPASSCDLAKPEPARGDGRNDGDDDDDDDSALPEFAMESQGQDGPASMDELLQDAPVVESASVVIAGSFGRELSLPGGLRVVVPQGAMPDGTTLTVRQHQLDGVPAGFWQQLYRFDTDNQPSSPISVTFPIPGFDEGAAPARTQVIWFHGQDPELIDGIVDDVAGTMTVQVAQLSSAVVDASPEPSAVPSSGDVVTQVPYHNQGASENCWSMSLTTLMNAYGATSEPWDNNRFFDLKSEHGLPFWQFVHTPGIVNHIHAFLPGVVVERKSWWSLDGTDDLREYLQANMRARRPTMVYYYSNEAGEEAAHMVLFVGIEGESFVIADPQVGQVYTLKTWEQITPRFSVTGFDGAGTLAFTTPVPAGVSDATIMIPYAARQNEGISFIRRVNRTFDLATARVFNWYIESIDGPGISDLQGAPGDLLLDHIAAWEVTVANTALAGAERTFRVGFEIVNGAGAVIYTHPEVSQRLAAGRITDVKLIGTARATELRTLVTAGGAYRVRFFVSDAGVRLDAVEMAMTVRAAEPTTCEPACGASQECCNGVCVFPAIDNQNCGGCGIVCSGTCGEPGCCLPEDCVSSTPGLNSFCGISGCFEQCGGVGTSAAIEAAGAYCQNVCGGEGKYAVCTHDFGRDQTVFCPEPDAMGCQCCPAYDD